MKDLVYGLDLNMVVGASGSTISHHFLWAKASHVTKPKVRDRKCSFLLEVETEEEKLKSNLIYQSLNGKLDIFSTILFAENPIFLCGHLNNCTIFQVTKH